MKELPRKRDCSGNPFFAQKQKKIVAESPVLFFLKMEEKNLPETRLSDVLNETK
jgi:hypothetical protein